MTIQDKLDARYGRTRTGRGRWGLGIAIGIGAVVVAAFAWMTYASNTEAVDSDTTGFQLVDEHSVVVEFQAVAPVGRAIACIVEAQDVEHGIVGWKVVEYPASEVSSRAFRETVPTTGEATTGFVNSCWVT